jgi:hypothetical protein
VVAKEGVWDIIGAGLQGFAEIGEKQRARAEIVEIMQAALLENLRTGEISAFG